MEQEIWGTHNPISDSVVFFTDRDEAINSIQAEMRSPDPLALEQYARIAGVPTTKGLNEELIQDGCYLVFKVTNRSEFVSTPDPQNPAAEILEPRMRNIIPSGMNLKHQESDDNTIDIKEFCEAMLKRVHEKNFPELKDWRDSTKISTETLVKRVVDEMYNPRPDTHFLTDLGIYLVQLSARSPYMHPYVFSHYLLPENKQDKEDQKLGMEIGNVTDKMLQRAKKFELFRRDWRNNPDFGFDTLIDALIQEIQNPHFHPTFAWIDAILILVMMHYNAPSIGKNDE